MSELPTGKQLWPHFLRRIAQDYKDGRAKPDWEIPSIVSACLDDVAGMIEAETAPSTQPCEFCDDVTAKIFLVARCHPTAPLMARKEGNVLILSCYLPDCAREVVRLIVKEVSS